MNIEAVCKICEMIALLCHSLCIKSKYGNGKYFKAKFLMREKYTLHYHLQYFNKGEIYVWVNTTI